MFSNCNSWKLLQTEQDCAQQDGVFKKKHHIILINFYDRISEATKCSEKKTKNLPWVKNISSFQIVNFQFLKTEY